MSARRTSDTGATTEKFGVEMEMIVTPVWASDGWVTVHKRSKQRREQEERAEHMKHDKGVNSDRKGSPKRSGRPRQIFVKVDNSKTVMLDNIERHSEGCYEETPEQSRCCADDMYASFEGKVLRGSDKMTACGVQKCSTLQAMSRVRGGRVHKNKKQVKRKKRETIRRSLRWNNKDKSKRSKNMSVGVTWKSQNQKVDRVHNYQSSTWR